jgi:quinol monooxygenase YgiN
MKVILRLAAKPDKVDELKAILLGLAGPTRKEPGCLSWEIFQNRADPCDFTFVEEWASDAALDAHWAAPHVQDALARGVPLLAAQPDDRRYTKIA